MNLYHLRYFVTLAHLEHYTKAAEILSITQPSLSHAISSLESERTELNNIDAAFPKPGHLKFIDT